MRRLPVQLRLLRDAAPALQIEQVVAKTAKRCVMLLGVAPAGILAQEVEYGCERAENVVRLDVELKGILGHYSIVRGGDKKKIKRR